ncbi:MAG: hypothetical protein H0V91_11190 [Flavisolibacter sp.]|nr:hypothetical protein [Flavisolibacter sp.]
MPGGPDSYRDGSEKWLKNFSTTFSGMPFPLSFITIDIVLKALLVLTETIGS